MFSSLFLQMTIYFTIANYVSVIKSRKAQQITKLRKPRNNVLYLSSSKISMTNILGNSLWPLYLRMRSRYPILRYYRTTYYAFGIKFYIPLISISFIQWKHFTMITAGLWFLEFIVIDKKRLSLQIL